MAAGFAIGRSSAIKRVTSRGRPSYGKPYTEPHSQMQTLSGSNNQKSPYRSPQEVSSLVGAWNVHVQ